MAEKMRRITVWLPLRASIDNQMRQHGVSRSQIVVDTLNEMRARSGYRMTRESSRLDRFYRGAHWGVPVRITAGAADTLTLPLLG